MQEEALKKDAEKNAKPEDKAPVPDGVPAEVRRIKPKRVGKRVRRVVQPAEVREAPRAPFRLAPVTVGATTYDKLTEVTPLPALIFSTTTYNNVIVLEVERTKRKQRNRRRAAAFLLLAA
jgi:hypothetical protein